MKINPLASLLGVMLPCVMALGANVLIVCDDVADPTTLDPQRQFAEKSHTICQQIFEGLVRFDPDGNVEPALAVKWERIDPLRIRFYLRQNVRFHNGEPFNAEAVRFSIERYLNPEIAFPGIPFIHSFSHAEVIDDHTVDIVTHYPDGLLLNRLAGFILIAPPQYVQEHGPNALHEHPIGTGPFRFVSWEKGQQIRMAANEHYWMPGYPKAGGLVFRFAPSDEQVKLLLAGEVDLVTELPGTLTLAVETAGQTRIIKNRTFWTTAATMTMDRGPLADVRVRRALNLAINQRDLVRYDIMGNGVPLASLTLPGQFGHNPDLKPYGYDVQRAAALLDEAGVKRPLVLRTLTRAQSERTLNVIKSHLAQIGVVLEIEAVVSDADAIERIRTESWDMVFGGGPDPMCHSFFNQSILIWSQSPYSLTNDPEFDRRLTEMTTTVDLDQQEILAQELDRYVHEQALCLFTYQRIKTYGLRREVTFIPYVTGMPYFFGVSIDNANSRTPRISREAIGAELP